MPRRKSKTWSYSVGTAPNTVCVYERLPGGPLYARIWEGTRHLRLSLKHRDKEAARAYAAQEHAKLIAGDEQARQGKVSLARLFALYETHRTPQKSATEQKEDRRRTELWTRHLGSDKDPMRISGREWENLIQGRSTGEIGPRGELISDPRDRRAVGPRTIERELRFLLAVFNWATRWRGDRGAYLLRENPARGFPIPKERNPRRPVATWDRYQALRAVSDRVTMVAPQKDRHGAQEVRSYLSEVLDLAVATGRRLSAIRQLRYAHLRLERTTTTPHGSIRWPADTDKAGVEQTVPLNALGRRAVDRIMAERPGIGDAPLFPSPADPSRPVDRSRADRWLRKAEALANLETQGGSLWHAFRRMWATSRKGLPAQDVARAGGWGTVSMVTEIYARADTETTLSVVLHEARVGEVR